MSATPQTPIILQLKSLTLTEMIDSASPRKSRKNVFFSRIHKNNKDSKNPYSTRGLDKFSELLTELEEKRQKIYSQYGSEDISFVRFVYKDSNDCVPVVVKLKNNNKKQDKTTKTEILNEVAKKSTISDLEREVKLQKRESGSGSESKKKKKNWNLNLKKWRDPSYYLPVFIILILSFLVFFGKSFSILFVSFGWYMFPVLTGSESVRRAKAKRPRKDKDCLRRRLSEKQKVISYGFASSSSSSPPKSNVDVNNSKMTEDESPQQVGYWNSY